MKFSLERSGYKRDSSREKSPYSVKLQIDTKKVPTKKAQNSPNRSPSPNTIPKLHIRYLTQKVLSKENYIDLLSPSSVETSLLLDKYRFQRHKNTVNSIVTDDEYMYSASSDYHICVWHKPVTISNTRIRKVPLFTHPSHIIKGHNKPIFCLCLLDCNRLVSSSADCSIKI